MVIPFKFNFFCQIFRVTTTISTEIISKRLKLIQLAWIFCWFITSPKFKKNWGTKKILGSISTKIHWKLHYYIGRPKFNYFLDWSSRFRDIGSKRFFSPQNHKLAEVNSRGKSLHLLFCNWILLEAIGLVCYYYFAYAIALKVIENTCKIKIQ